MSLEDSTVKMYNTLSRISNVFSYFTTVVSVIAAVIAFTSLITTPIPAIKEGGLLLGNVQIVKGRPHYYTSKKEEFAHIKFDLDIDLSSLFTWNTKQVFLYITATYPSTTPGAPPSQAIIWDAILTHPLSPEHHNTYVYPATTKKSKLKKTKPAKPAKQIPGLLRLEGQRPKYQITDPSGKLADRANVTLELNWNIQPWVGALQWSSAGSKSGTSLFGFERWLGTWRSIPSLAAKTVPFDFPALKERSEAVKAAGKEGLGTDRGAERYRGSPHVG